MISGELSPCLGRETSLYRAITTMRRDCFIGWSRDWREMSLYGMCITIICWTNTERASGNRSFWRGNSRRVLPTPSCCKEGKTRGSQMEDCFWRIISWRSRTVSERCSRDGPEFISGNVSDTTAIPIPVGIIFDIGQAFLQLGLNKRDRDLTRIFWYRVSKDEDENYDTTKNMIPTVSLGCHWASHVVPFSYLLL